MSLLAWALVLPAAGGTLASFLRSPRYAALLGGLAAAGGAVVGLILAIDVLAHGPSITETLPWGIPFGTAAAGLDGLSALVLAALCLVAIPAALYGIGYAPAHLPRSRSTFSWLPFGLLVSSMMLVIAARDLVLFAFAWETMTITSWLLVVLLCEEQPSVRAGTVYLVAAHVGAAVLLPLLAWTAGAAGTTALCTIPLTHTGPLARALALCAVLVAFGTKAGIVPLHSWLPEAHPVAPSHVSALMSGAMVNLGIYGILRFAPLYGPPPVWWGSLLLLLGAGSAVWGIIMAQGQNDLKRSLAFSTIENLGLVTMAVGTGALGTALGISAMAILGYAAACAHLLTHACVKALLFCAAGSVAGAAHGGNIERLGGVARSMPATALLFGIGAAGVAGLPPLGACASELLIILAAFEGLGAASGAGMLVAALVITAVALAGGLAVGAFTRLFGVVFLGEPREKITLHEVPLGMIIPQALLAICVLASGILLLRYLPVIAPAVIDAGHFAPLDVARALGRIAPVGVAFAYVGIAVVLLAGVLILARWMLLRTRSVRSGVTWDCGYAQPTARMQYTGTAFSEPSTDFFSKVIDTRSAVHTTPEPFPATPWRLSRRVPDRLLESIYEPLFSILRRVSVRIATLGARSVHAYVLALAATLLALVLWTLAWK